MHRKPTPSAAFFSLSDRCDDRARVIMAGSRAFWPGTADWRTVKLLGNLSALSHGFALRVEWDEQRATWESSSL